jgi:hypothetical protein
MTFLGGLAGGILGAAIFAIFFAIWMAWSPPRVSCENGAVAWTVAETARRVDALKVRLDDLKTLPDVLSRLDAFTRKAPVPAACPPAPACPTQIPEKHAKPNVSDADGADIDGHPELDAKTVNLQ